MASCIQYNDAAFRALFPTYANANNYPVPVIQANWNSATLYISNRYTGSCWNRLTLAQQTQAINLMTAHLLYVAGQIAAGKTSVVVAGATIDKIALTLEPPPAANQWQWWLNTSPFGIQLLALLQVASVGGFYFPGSVPGRAGFGFGGA